MQKIGAYHIQAKIQHIRKEMAELEDLVLGLDGTAHRVKNPTLDRCFKEYQARFNRPLVAPGEDGWLFAVNLMQDIHKELYNKKPGLAVIEDYLCSIQENGTTEEC